MSFIRIYFLFFVLLIEARSEAVFMTVYPWEIASDSDNLPTFFAASTLYSPIPVTLAKSPYADTLIPAFVRTVNTPSFMYALTPSTPSALIWSTISLRVFEVVVTV